MLRSETAKDRDALEIMRQGIQDLTLYFMLAGLSILGEAVEVVEAPGVQTLCTDGRKIYYDPKWMKILEPRGYVYVMFDILHEWLHIFANHVARVGDRDKKLWNIAADVFVVAECCRILSELLGESIAPPLSLIHI